MTTCLENLTDNCYKKSFFIPKTKINFEQIRAAVLAFRNKLKNKYPWKTGECKNNYEIPGRDLDFKTLLMAQALGDARALATRKYPLLRLHLTNRSAGIDQILSAAQSL